MPCAGSNSPWGSQRWRARCSKRFLAITPDYASVADEEAQAHLALGLTERALERYEALLEAIKRRAQAEPDRARLPRDLSISYNKMDDLHTARPACMHVCGQFSTTRRIFAEFVRLFRSLVATMMKSKGRGARYNLNPG